MMRADDLAVEEHITVHINAVEAQHHALRQPFTGDGERAHIPGVGRFVEVVFVCNQKIMRQINRMQGRR